MDNDSVATGGQSFQAGGTFTVPSMTGTAKPVSVYDAPLFALRELRDYNQHLVGCLLTLVDVAGIEQTQRRALVSLIKREAWEAHYEEALRWAERQLEIVRTPGLKPTNPFPFSHTGSTVSVG